MNLKNISLSYRTLIKVSFFALFFIVLMIASFNPPYHPTQVNLGERLLPMDSEHLLGTDQLGRDILSRLLAGFQTTVGTSLFVLAMSLGIGLPIGLLSGFLGGRVDRFCMKIVDAFLAFPDYIAAIILSGLLGPGMFNLIMAIVVVKWVSYARLARSTVLSEKEKDYIAMAKINRLGSLAILRKHLLPHVIGNILVLAALDVGKIILMIASLSYIGLGAQPPSPEWGTMLNEGRSFFQSAPHLMMIPGAAIMIIVLYFNLLGDLLKDHFDVKNKG